MLLALGLGLLNTGMQSPNTLELIEKSLSKTLVVGHRGAAANKPENTVASFEEAIASGADATECDIRLSQDGHIVVMHDATLDRTTSLKGNVADTPLSRMQSAGVPTLADLTKITKNRIVLVVEIKGGEGIEKKMIDHLNDEGMREQSIIFSFGVQHIAKVEELDPRFFSVWLISKKQTPANMEATFAEAKRIGASGLGFSYNNIVPEMILEARKRKIPVFVWTVPPGPEVEKLQKLHVNFIITDHPRDVLKRLTGS